MNSLQISTFEYISTYILCLFQAVIWDGMVKIAPRCVTIAMSLSCGTISGRCNTGGCALPGISTSILPKLVNIQQSKIDRRIHMYIPFLLLYWYKRTIKKFEDWCFKIDTLYGTIKNCWQEYKTTKTLKVVKSETKFVDN